VCVCVCVQVNDRMHSLDVLLAPKAVPGGGAQSCKSVEPVSTMVFRVNGDFVLAVPSVGSGQGLALRSQIHEVRLAVVNEVAAPVHCTPACSRRALLEFS
jgi:hypothetical protein